jgi:hypothetical protein
MALGVAVQGRVAHMIAASAKNALPCYSIHSIHLFRRAVLATARQAPAPLCWCAAAVAVLILLPH